jgi:hypothetical protein
MSPIEGGKCPDTGQWISYTISTIEFLDRGSQKDGLRLIVDVESFSPCLFEQSGVQGMAGEVLNLATGSPFVLLRWSNCMT